MQKSFILILCAGLVIPEFRAIPIVGVGVGFGTPLLLKKALLGGAVVKPLLVKKSIFVGSGALSAAKGKGFLAVGGGLVVKKVTNTALLGAKALVSGKAIVAAGKIGVIKTKSTAIGKVAGGIGSAKLFAGKAVFGAGSVVGKVAIKKIGATLIGKAKLTQTTGVGVLGVGGLLVAKTSSFIGTTTKSSKHDASQKPISGGAKALTTSPFQSIFSMSTNEEVPMPQPTVIVKNHFNYNKPGAWPVVTMERPAPIVNQMQRPTVIVENHFSFNQPRILEKEVLVPASGLLPIPDFQMEVPILPPVAKPIEVSISANKEIVVPVPKSAKMLNLDIAEVQKVYLPQPEPAVTKDMEVAVSAVKDAIPNAPVPAVSKDEKVDVAAVKDALPIAAETAITKDVDVAVSAIKDALSISPVPAVSKDVEVEVSAIKDALSIAPVPAVTKDVEVEVSAIKDALSIAPVPAVTKDVEVEALAIKDALSIAPVPAVSKDVEVEVSTVKDALPIAAESTITKDVEVAEVTKNMVSPGNLKLLLTENGTIPEVLLA